MNKAKALLIAGVLVVIALGCGTTNEKENMLTAAGFKMVPADTQEKLAHLNSLPEGKITPVQRAGTLYYAFPDKKNNMLYVGQQEQYQEYQKLRLQKQMADEQLSAADANENAWGVWGPPVVWGFRR
jgi:hypothetical protein